MIEKPVHILLEMNNEIMTISSDRKDCHPDAKYWFPLNNVARLEIYLKMARITTIESISHFTRLLASAIVQKL